MNYFGYPSETILISPFADQYSSYMKSQCAEHVWGPAGRMTGKSSIGKQETVEPCFAKHNKLIYQIVIWPNNRYSIKHDHTGILFQTHNVTSQLSAEWHSPLLHFLAPLPVWAATVLHVKPIKDTLFLVSPATLDEYAQNATQYYSLLHWLLNLHADKFIMRIKSSAFACLFS